MLHVQRVSISVWATLTAGVNNAPRMRYTLKVLPPAESAIFMCAEFTKTPREIVKSGGESVE